MTAHWKQVVDGTSQGHAARAGGFTLSVVGSDHLWHWLVRHDDSSRTARGREQTLAAAMAAAENAAHRLARDAR
jgi:hypothetical protein